MRHLSWESRIALLGLFLSLLFCLGLAAEWWYARHYREHILEEIFKVGQAQFEMQAIPAYPFQHAPVEHYASIIERPIFFEGRKPIEKVEDQSEQPDASPVAKQPVEPFKYTLTGILNTPKGVVALFQNQQAANYPDKYKRLKVGESLDEWKLIAIESDSVSIQADAEPQQIPLLKAKPKTTKSIPNGPGAIPVPGQQAAGTVPPPPNANPFNIKK